MEAKFVDCHDGRRPLPCYQSTLESKNEAQVRQLSSNKEAEAERDEAEDNMLTGWSQDTPGAEALSNCNQSFMLEFKTMEGLAFDTTL